MGSLAPRLFPMVDREAEMQILLDHFRLARSGTGQAVLITGDAGIGKSRLVRALAERLAGAAPVWLTAHGSAFAQNTPLVPMVHLLTRTVFGPDGGAGISGERRLDRLEEVLAGYGLPGPDYAPLLGALLSLPTEERYPPLVLSPEARRKRTLAAVLALLAAMAERHPLVLVIEDLHWVDPSTLELLDRLLGEIPVLPLLLVATFRPEFSAPWRHRTSVTQLNLGGLSEAHTAELIERVSEGKRLPAEMRREIAARTDGIPLFIEELTKTVLVGDAPAAIPLTLGGWLLARLDRLGEAKAVAQLAAVLGRTFTLEQLEALSWIKGAALRTALEQLLQAEILHRRGSASRARYVFKHALIQDAAHLSLLASDRQRLHRELVHLLQEDFPEMAEAEPELMAFHCEHGGLAEEAADYLLQAGQRAMRRSAMLEAVSHLTRALELLLALPAAPERLGRELTLRSVLGAVLPAIKGWGAPEVGANAERCVALCRELGDHGRLIPSLYALWDHHLLRGDGPPAIELSAEIARLAETPAQVFIGYLARAQTAFERGQSDEALPLLEQAAALFEPTLHPELAQAFGEESSLMPHLHHFWVLAIVGRPDAAVRKRDVVLAAVETQSSPFLLAMALTFEMILWHQLLSPERVAAVAERLQTVTEEQEFALLLAFAHVGQGWAACQRGDLAAGTARIEKGLELQEATGAQLVRRYLCVYLVEAHLAAGRAAEGLATVRRILVRPEDRLGAYLDSELFRLEGELLRASGDAAAAEASFRKALGIARDQGARAFELRTATSLGRLLAEQGRAAEALPPLAAVYQTYTEGFETRDLQDARELLDRLAPRQALHPQVPGES
jgi:predicted ATPase